MTSVIKSNHSAVSTFSAEPLKSSQLSDSDSKAAALRKAIFPNFHHNEKPHHRVSHVVKHSQIVVMDTAIAMERVFYAPEAFEALPYVSAQGLATFDILWSGSAAVEAFQRMLTGIASGEFDEALEGAALLLESLFAGFNDIVESLDGGAKIFAFLNMIHEKLTALIEAVKSHEGLLAVWGIMYAVSIGMQSMALHQKRKLSNAFEKYLKQLDSALKGEEKNIYAWISFIEKKLTGKREVVSALDGKIVTSYEKKKEDLYARSLGGQFQGEELIREVRKKMEEEFRIAALEEAEKKLREGLKKYSLPTMPSLKVKEAARRIFSDQELIAQGREMALAKWEKRKEKKVAHIISEEELYHIKEAMFEKNPLSKQILSENPADRAQAIQKGKEIVKDIGKTKHMIASAVLIGCAIIGLLAASLFPAIGIPAAICSVLLLCMSMARTTIDVGLYLRGLSDDKLNKLDPHVLVLSSILCLASLITGIVLVSLYVLPISSSLLIAIGLAWLLVNGYTYYRVRANRENYKMEHPELQDFAEKLKTLSAEQIPDLFAKLSRENRIVIKDAIETVSKSYFFSKKSKLTRRMLQEATEKAIRREERAMSWKKKLEEREKAVTRAAFEALVLQENTLKAV